MIKKSIAGIISLVVVTALFLSPLLKDTKSLNENVHTSTNSSESAKSTNEYSELNGEGKTKNDLRLSKAQSALKLSREIELAATKSELEQLMLDYNDNLKNTEVKQELESKIAALLKKYNEQVLPIALDKIQGSDKSGT